MAMATPPPPMWPRWQAYYMAALASSSSSSSHNSIPVAEPETNNLRCRRVCSSPPKCESEVLPLSKVIETFPVYELVPAGALLMKALRSERLERGLVHMVVLPIVWLTLCCVVGAAVGIECVETLRDTLGSEGSTKAMPAKKHKQSSDNDEDRKAREHDPRPSKKARRETEFKFEQDDDSKLRKRRPSSPSPNPAEEEEVPMDLTSPKKSMAKKTLSATSSVLVRHQTMSGPVAVPVRQPVSCRRRRRRVYIWDLDETLVLFASLYSGEFARAHRKEVATSVALGEQMMSFLLAVLDRHFYFHQLHDVEVNHIASLPAVFDDRVLKDEQAMPLLDKHSPEFMQHVAARFERIRALYEHRWTADFLDDKSSQWFVAREALVASIDIFSGGWIKEAHKILQLITPLGGMDLDDPTQDINVLVSNSQLAPALCKMLIYGFDAYFSIDSVYSSAKLRKHRCFEKILDKYGSQDVEFVAIGDGQEEATVSRALGIPFCHIHSLDDLQQLRVNLDLVERRKEYDATHKMPGEAPRPQHVQNEQA